MSQVQNQPQSLSGTSGPATSVSHGETLFVSNLAYTTTNSSLEAAFSNLAPIKSAFVVFRKDSDGGRDSISTGVGYVTFAFKDDTESTMKRFGENEPIIVDGRRVRLQWANRKPAVLEGKPLGKPIQKAAKQTQSFQSSIPDAKAIRTVVLSNIPADIPASTLWKKIRKQDGAESVEWPVRHSTTGAIVPGVAHALFQTPSDAHTAITRLHAHVYKGSFISAALKKRVETVGRAGGASGGEPSKAGRLIVRNLPNSVTENDMHALFSPYGPVHSVNIPSITPSPVPRKSRFAFVWMLSKTSAENAITMLNGTKVIPGISTRLAANAANKHGQRIKEPKFAVDPQGDEVYPLDRSGNVTEQPSIVDEGRLIAVDWALSKDKWEQLKSNLTPESVNTPQREESTDVLDSEGSETATTHSGNDSLQPKAGERQIQEQTHGPPLPDEGTTLFIRNVPFEASDDDLHMLFKTFGRLRYARVTKDDSGRSRGSGFVCFWNLADADAVVSESQRIKTESGLVTANAPKVNPFTLLTPDPASSSAAALVLMGRTLDVMPAVDREQARRLKEQGEKARDKKDPRNLYLMREGVIFEGSEAALTLSPIEIERRMAAYQARKQLVKSNPSLYVSRTRLSIRQLPPFVSERVLKRLGLYAIKAFEEEARAGLRDGLTSDELAVDIVSEKDGNGPAEGHFTKSLGQNRPCRPARGVRQAKISRQADRIDPLSGKGRSKGYGFLEMCTHCDALRVLRWTNNQERANDLLWTWWKEELQNTITNPTKSSVGGLPTSALVPDAVQLKLVKNRLLDVDEDKPRKIKPLIVEFSIENAVVNKRRATREQIAKELRTDAVGQASSSASKRNRPTEKEDDQRPQKRLKKSQIPRSLEQARVSNVEGPSATTEGQGKLGRILKKRRQRKNQVQKT